MGKGEKDMNMNSCCDCQYGGDDIRWTGVVEIHFKFHLHDLKAF